MSTQFTAMNTITLADLTDDNASSGNSVLAVTQQLSISLGVAVSAAVPSRLRRDGRHNDSRTIPLYVYHDGIITVASAAMFMLLKTTDGNNLIKRQRKSKPNHVPSESE
ncbi:major facilitator superfamily protein [Escherichia coli]|uniref:Major facilitator superfamily protein n=1 Tax=Escherichia coli TaxID=562 RepID=A0A376WCJ7_ECOLX|nr:major facilitator superfamily protein [Escherichia coli]